MDKTLKVVYVRINHNDLDSRFYKYGDNQYGTITYSRLFIDDYRTDGNRKSWNPNSHTIIKNDKITVKRTQI